MRGDEELLRCVGEEVLGWKFLNVVSLEDLEGERHPVFWAGGRLYEPEFYFAWSDESVAIRWDPLEDDEQRNQVLEAVRSKGGRVSINGDSLSAQCEDGLILVYADVSPRCICRAALAAIGAEPPVEY